MLEHRAVISEENRMSRPALLLYDATCAFCDAGSNRVLNHVPAGSVERADVNDPEIQARYAISREAAQREMYLVNAAGKVSHGIWAIGELLTLTHWGWLVHWLWYIPGFTLIGQRVYLWIAAHRYLLMGRTSEKESCEDDACSVHLGEPKK